MKSTRALRPRILFVASVGATLRYFVEPLAVELQAQGFDTIAAAADLGGTMVFDRSYDLPPFRRRPLSDMVRAYRRLNRIVEVERPALMHLHTPPALAIGRLTARRHHVPCVAVIHGTFLEPFEARSLTYATVEAALARLAAHTVVLNADDQRFYAHLVHDMRISRAPVGGMGIDTRALEVARRSPRRLAPHPSILVLGRLTPEKNLDRAVDAFQIVRNVLPDASLTFVGSPASGDEGWMVPSLPGLFHVPWVDDPYAVVAGSDLVVSASTREGFSMGIVEALALGIPVVAVTNRGVRHIKRAGAGGLTVVGDSVGELSAAITRGLLQHREIDNRRLTLEWSRESAIAFHVAVIRKALCGE